MQEMEETQVWSLGQEDSLEKGMTTHSSIHTMGITESLCFTSVTNISLLTNYTPIQNEKILKRIKKLSLMQLAAVTSLI